MALNNSRRTEVTGSGRVSYSLGFKEDMTSPSLLVNDDNLEKVEIKIEVDKSNLCELVDIKSDLIKEVMDMKNCIYGDKFILETSFIENGNCMLFENSVVTCIKGLGDQNAN